MKRLILALSLFSVVSLANATCSEPGDTWVCTYENSGVKYTVVKDGNTTYRYGNNSKTGDQWSEKSTKVGTTTVSSGKYNGKAWNKTETLNEGIYNAYGTDTKGQHFDYSSDAYNR